MYLFPVPSDNLVIFRRLNNLFYFHLRLKKEERFWHFVFFPFYKIDVDVYVKVLKSFDRPWQIYHEAFVHLRTICGQVVKGACVNVAFTLIHVINPLWNPQNLGRLPPALTPIFTNIFNVCAEPNHSLIVSILWYEATDFN